MSKDRTGETNGGRSFEERVFLRFDAIDNRLGSVDARLDNVEGRLGGVETRLGTVETRLGTVETRLEVLEAKSYDTKPIWERALAEIAQARQEARLRFEDFDVRLDRVESVVNASRSEMLTFRADFKEFRGHFKESV